MNSSPVSAVLDLRGLDPEQPTPLLADDQLPYGTSNSMPSSGLAKRKSKEVQMFAIRVDDVEGSNAVPIIVFFLAFLLKHSVHCATGNSIGS
jgi:hypothetical protein